MRIKQLVELASLTAVAGLMVYSELHVRCTGRANPPIGQVAPADGQPVVMPHTPDGALQAFVFSSFGQVAEHDDASAFDRPGYGHREWRQDERLSLDVEACLIHQALDQLDVEDPLLVGHS
jgi:pimeloyl-ACP methyl ester carboxylesterase